MPVFANGAAKTTEPILDFRFWIEGSTDQ